MATEQTIKLGNGTSISGKNLRVRTREEWIAKAEELYGKNPSNWKFRCPNCKAVQSAVDFKKLKDEGHFNGVIENVVYFSCIGRYTPGCKGEIGNNIQPCNYTNGGLFCFANDYVKVEDDEKRDAIPVFSFADEEEPDGHS